ncbi:MAG: small multi-drug export protein [Patescibacteria group bacterium]|jgi:uncharacterized membrane protein
MTEALVAALNGIPHWLGTMALAATPIAELRGAIPAGIFGWEMTWWSAFIFAILGNLIPLIPLYFGLETLRKILGRIAPSLLGVLDRFIERSRKKLEKNYEKYGALGLCIFTAIPLPLTGLWSATVAAVALKIPFRFAAPAITLGVIIAGVIVTTLCLTGNMIF